MRVIGIDPGSRACGYGIIEGSGNDYKYISSGSIVPPSGCDLSNRLKIIYSGLSEVINKYSPTIMSIEDIFFAKNAKSAIKLGQARGVAVLAAAKNNLLVSEYSPTQIKLALTGKGRANKAEIQKMLLYMLDIKEFKNTDESDAVAIAICHINLSKFESVNGVEIRNNKRRNKRFKLNDIIT